MVVSGNAGRNFSPLRPPCPVTITLTHLPNCFAPCFFRHFAARLAYCCPASLCFLIHPLPSLIAPLMLLLIAFAPRSSISLLPFAPRFGPPLCSSPSLLPFAPPFRSPLSLLASPLTFTHLLAHHWFGFHDTSRFFAGGNSDGALAKTEINICASWRGRGAKSQGPGEAAF